MEKKNCYREGILPRFEQRTEQSASWREAVFHHRDVTPKIPMSHKKQQERGLSKNLDFKRS